MGIWVIEKMNGSRGDPYGNTPATELENCFGLRAELYRNIPPAKLAPCHLKIVLSYGQNRRHAMPSLC